MNKPKPTFAMIISHGIATYVFDMENEKLLDGQDVLQMMHISPRTLQTLRTKGILPYSKIAGKIFYRLSDVWEMVEKNRVEKK